MEDLDQTGVRNRLLRAIPAEAFDVLRPHFERVTLSSRETLEVPQQQISHVYFPEPGVISVIAVNGEGERQEVAVIGPEGMTGTSLLYGFNEAAHISLVQMPCRALRIQADRLRALLSGWPAMNEIFWRYAGVLAAQIAHTALANGRYALEARLARWLLMCHDRIDREDLPLTHEFLGVMLGVRRAGVTTALHVLEGEGIVKTQRGSVVLVNRHKLEKVAGGAYGAPEDEYNRMLPEVAALR